MSGFPEKWALMAGPGSMDPLMVGKQAGAVKSARSNQGDQDKLQVGRHPCHLRRQIAGKSNKIHMTLLELVALCGRCKA
jgi:hypothetical protein